MTSGHDETAGQPLRQILQSGACKSTPPDATPAPPPSPRAATLAVACQQLDVLSPDPVVVTTAQELQHASRAKAVDIEVRAHLDIRGLPRTENPALLGEESETNQKRYALLYTAGLPRSIRVSPLNTSPDDTTSLGTIVAIFFVTRWLPAS